MKQIIIPYNEAIDLIDEADILLFRSGRFWTPGYWIAKYGKGIHSHAALATRVGEDWNCVEFREGAGARSVSLRGQADCYTESIDIFRISPEIHKNSLHKTPSGDYTTYSEASVFDREVAQEITKEMNSLTGNKYSWWTIVKFAKGLLPFTRLFSNNYSFDDTKVSDGFVCSTSIAYAYRKFGFDLIPMLSDGYTAPPDLARSAVLQYLFTIGDV